MYNKMYTCSDCVYNSLWLRSHYHYQDLRDFYHFRQLTCTLLHLAPSPLQTTTKLVSVTDQICKGHSFKLWVLCDLKLAYFSSVNPATFPFCMCADIRTLSCISPSFCVFSALYYKLHIPSAEANLCTVHFAVLPHAFAHPYSAWKALSSITNNLPCLIYFCSAF